MRQHYIRIAGAVIASVFVGNAFAVDSQLLNLVMPDAQVMAGMNVTNSEISPLGTFILLHLSNDQNLEKLIAATGFDPRKDLTEMLAASNGSQTAPASLVLAKGNFDVAKIVAQVSQSSNQQVSQYAGATLITGLDAKDTGAAAFIGSSIAIAGNVASVKAALDRSSGVNSISPALATQVHTLSTTEDAWSVSMASLGALIPGAIASPGSADGMAGQTLQLVKNIQSSSAGLKFGANVQFTAQAVADTPQDASALGDVIKMIASLAAMSAGSNPDAAAIAQTLQSLQVTTTGATVNLAATVPEAQVETLLSAALAPKAATAKKLRKM
jgi:hypothetical protein